MYPTLYHAFKDLFGVEWHWAIFLNSFGFFVAVAFGISSSLLTAEIKRMQSAGFFKSHRVEVWIGRPAPWSEIFVNAVFGFLIGWKFLYLFLGPSEGLEPREILFSAKGFYVIGVFTALAFGAWRWYEGKKAQLTSPLKETREIWPSDFAGNITMYSALFGFAGAKLFHLIENPSEFVQFFSNPSVESFISGLTVYGGLIFGSMGVLIYARSKKIPLRRLCDAAAPAMIIGYGIGRIGCQVSGDGDWGIANPHPQPAYLAWMPGWLWAYDYPNNVNHDARYEGYLGPLNDTYVEKITDPKVPCYEGYCTHLVPPVYPTPVYETFMATVIFAILWLLRRKLKIPGQLFALYLILNGCERFLIEQIRVNNKFELLGMIWTQAELIAVGFIATGFGLMAFLSRYKRPHTQLSQDGQQN